MCSYCVRWERPQRLHQQFGCDAGYSSSTLHCLWRPWALKAHRCPTESITVAYFTPKLLVQPLGALPMYTVGVYRSRVPARRAPRKHLTDTTQDACSLYGGSGAMHGRTWATCTELQPQYCSNNIVCPFIFVVTVAVLSPTNLLCTPTVNSTEIHNTCRAIMQRTTRHQVPPRYMCGSAVTSIINR